MTCIAWWENSSALSTIYRNLPPPGKGKDLISGPALEATLRSFLPNVRHFTDVMRIRLSSNLCLRNMSRNSSMHWVRARNCPMEMASLISLSVHVWSNIWTLRKSSNSHWNRWSEFWKKAEPYTWCTRPATMQQCWPISATTTISRDLSESTTQKKLTKYYRNTGWRSERKIWV